MDTADMVAVVGSCAHERLRHAERLARVLDRAFLCAAELGDTDPVSRAVDLLTWHRTAAGTVVEFPATVDVMELIGSATAATTGHLSDIVCVVDAAHVLIDLDRDDYVAPSFGNAQEMTAAALLFARQIEYASVVVLVNWASLPTTRLSTLMALVSHLSPRAHLRLHRGDSASPLTGVGYAAGQDQAGWLRLLNGDFDPAFTDSRVSALRYEHVRPLHAARLERLLHTIDSGRFGKVIRSVGFCRLASRPHIVALWDHVGHMVSLTPLGLDSNLGDDEELLVVGVELAFMGIDLDAGGLRAELDDAVLTDAELSAGPPSWTQFADPFPRWHIASEHAD